jgi:hypothetical protein
MTTGSDRPATIVLPGADISGQILNLPQSLAAGFAF